MTHRMQGYAFVCITMLIWGGFTISSRFNHLWHINAWDLTALRFILAFCILFPILLYRKETSFLWHRQPFILGLIGGVAYCLTVYTAFLYAPAAHAAIFLNGCIPVFTAFAAYFILREAVERHTWISLAIMLFSVAVMSWLMYRSTGAAFNVGDLLFINSALYWGIFTVLLKKWQLTAWQAMSSVAIWSALIYVPIYLLFIPKHLSDAEPKHLILQALFHGILVVMVATWAYIEAIKRLGPFRAGSIVSLAPFLAALLAVPLLNEALSPAIAFGLLGMGIGALQPWRWIGRKAP